jgi:hypothetical protein
LAIKTFENLLQNYDALTELSAARLTLAHDLGEQKTRYALDANQT